MPDTLPISINGDRMHAIEAAPSFETADSFRITLESNGTPAHVHLHLDDELSTVATLETNNHYVDGRSDVFVRVEDGPRPVRGRLDVATGYGTNSESVAVTVIEPVRGEHYVDVDEGLGVPQPKEDEDDEPDRSLPDVSLGLVALGVLALVLAVWAATAIGSTAVGLGAAVVVCGVIAAAYFYAA